MNFFIFIRKVRSLIGRAVGGFYTAINYINALGNQSIFIGSGCDFGRGVALSATDGGKIIIGSRVSISTGVQIISCGGKVTIGDDVFIGPGVIITSKDSVEVGGGCQIAEYVVIRDQDHRVDTRPIRDSGFLTSPIQIGTDVWIGSKATILRGASLGDGCVIGAHALVRSCIPADSLAVGVPARVIKQLASNK